MVAPAHKFQHVTICLMEESPKSEVPPVLLRKYRQQAEMLLRQHGNDFDHFVENLKGLIREGDRLLLDKKITGYNILLSGEDMDLMGNRRLIFYSNYIANTEHFAQLIAELVMRVW